MSSELNESPYQIRRSLKWRPLIVLSVVLFLVNASLAYMVYRKTTGQFGKQQFTLREIQHRELSAALSKGQESLSAFASFIPLLSSKHREADLLESPQRIPQVLHEHGVMLHVEWGVEGVHYLAADGDVRPMFSWPVGRKMPAVGELLESVARAEAPQGRILCEKMCAQVIALPLLRHGSTAGYLVVERSLADSLQTFNKLSGADVAVLKTVGKDSEAGGRFVLPWARLAPFMTHEDLMLPVLRQVAEKASLQSIRRGPVTVYSGGEWYEASALPTPFSSSDVTILILHKVTDQVLAIRDATIESIAVGIAGLVVSEIILLFVLWAPMRRIHDIANVLPLLAAGSHRRLRETLTAVAGRRHNGDEIDAMSSAIVDVSMEIEKLDAARWAAEKALREREQNLQMAQSIAKVASWRGRPIDGVFEFTNGVNRIHADLAGIRNWVEVLRLIHCDDRLNVQNAWREAPPSSRMDIEFRLQIGGKGLDVRAVAQFSAADAKGVVHVIGVMQDISEMRENRRMLKDSRDRLEDEVLARTAELVSARGDAERLAETKGEFLAHMSHEIRTPLNAVLGLSQIGMQQSHNRSIASTFEEILDAGEHLLNIVNDVLDLTKLEAGKLRIASETFDVREVVNQSARLLRTRVDAKSLDMPINIDANLPGHLLGDSFRLQQILINLLSNAVKFTEQGSVSIDVYRDAGECCFKVADTGIGMTASQLSGLFNPYQQVESNSKRQQEGTGLGLSISQTLATLMGGTIRVKSEPGVGSEFLLRLPLPATRAARHAPCVGDDGDGPTGDRLSGVRVLVADDVLVNRKIVDFLLSTEGARVTMVTDGAEAVDAVLRSKGGAFDVILMDLEMPNTDGRQATRLLRRSGISVPIIGVSAHVGQRERDAASAAGMDDLLVKPILKEDLIALVLRVTAPDRNLRAGDTESPHSMCEDRGLQ